MPTSTRNRSGPGADRPEPTARRRRRLHAAAGAVGGLQLAAATTVVAVVAAGVLTVAAPSSAAAQAAPAATRAARDVPGLTSQTPAPKPPDAPAGDFSDPPPHPSEAARRRAKPSSFDPARSVPVDSETTATQRVLKNTNGSRTVEISSRPVRFRDPATGTWTDFDLNLVSAADGSLGAKAAPGAGRIGATATGAVASVATEAGTISLRHPEAVAVPAVVSKDRAVYPKAMGPNRDLVLAATRTASRRRLCCTTPGPAPPTAASSSCLRASAPSTATTGWSS